MPGVSNDSVDLPLVFDQMRNFAGGVDSFRDPIDLDPDQSQYLLNVVIRDKLKARTRPGADPLGDARPGANAHTQGLIWFNTPSTSQLLTAVNGSVYKWAGSSWSAALSWALANATTRLEAAQGVDKLLLTDGVGNLQSYDGTTFTDLNSTASDPPLGMTILCWHTGRMFGSGQATNPDTIYVSNRLNFGRGQWNTTTRAFRVGDGDGDPITALVRMPSFVLVVFKQNSVWFCVTDPRNEPADFSADQANEEQSEGIGCVGKRAWCRYGNDILFFAQDGVRSFRRMVAAQGQFELGAPISVPIQSFIDRVNPNYQHLICATKYREFALFAVPLDTSTYNNAVLVWNGRLGKWIGVWDGWTPAAWELTRFSGIQRLVFGDHTGYVNQWKDLDADDDDDTYEDNGAGYASKLWTRSMTFGDLEASKSAFNTRIRFNAGRATMNLTAVGDDAALNQFSQAIGPTGDILGTDPLPFTLASQNPTVLPFSLRGLPAFNEMYLKIESSTGWWELRNLTVGARVRPLKRK